MVRSPLLVALFAFGGGIAVGVPVVVPVGETPCAVTMLPGAGPRVGAGGGGSDVRTIERTDNAMETPHAP